MEFSKVFKVNKSVSEKEFLREVLEGLSRDPATPADIMTATFGEVKELSKEFCQVGVEVDVHYSGSVGYDRQEQYITQDFKHLHAGDIYTVEVVIKYAEVDAQYKCDVQKTRTVTDWRPHSGNDHFTIVATEVNGSTGDQKFSRLFGALLKEIASDEDSGDEIEGASSTMDPDAYNRAIASAQNTAQKEVKWPGDHQKDESYSFESEIPDGKGYVYICPYYVVEYEYRGKKFIAKGFAFGEPNEIHEAPAGAVEVASEDSLRRECTQKIQEAQKKPMLFGKIGVAAFVLGIFITIIGFANVAAVGVVGLIVLIGGLAGSGICFLKLKSIEKQTTKKYDGLIAALRDQKAVALEKKLEEMGLNSTKSAN